MRTKQIGVAGITLCVLACLGYPSAARAMELGSGVDLHGYGSQDYLQTSHNRYLGADHRGTWDQNFLALVGTVTLNDKSKLWAQLEASSNDSNRFTWFFVDYQLTDAVRLHAGRVKYPLGLYNEFIDAKFIQVSSLEPALYQTAADVVHDSYTGGGLDYTQSLGRSGEILWQVYGGNTFDVTPPPDSRDRRALGGRITYQTPVDGLRFMLSGYRTQVELLATLELVREDRLIGSVDYVHGDWDVKSEYGTRKFLGISSNAYYAQMGHTLASIWMPFIRYDRVNTNTELSGRDSFSQTIFVFGLNYRLQSNISLRVEDHLNRGYALPVSSGEIPVGQGARSWNMLVAGVHFMF